VKLFEIKVEYLLKFLRTRESQKKRLNIGYVIETERFADQNSDRHEVFRRTWAQWTRAASRPRSLHTRRSRILTMRTSTIPRL